MYYLEYNTIVVVCWFLVAVGNSFWCFAHTQCTIQLCCCVSFWKIKSSSCLSGGCAIVITTRKKSSSHLSGGCAIVITTGKKKFQSSVWRVRDYYYFYHGSDLREIIRFLRKIECIELKCNEFVLVLFKLIDLIHFEHPNYISLT